MQKRKEEKLCSERSNKKIRVNSSLSKTTHEKLDRLALACGLTKTSLAAYLVDLCLNHENIVNFVQEQYKHQSRFRIIPSKINGELKFIFVEKNTTYN